MRPSPGGPSVARCAGCADASIQRKRRAQPARAEVGRFRFAQRVLLLNVPFARHPTHPRLSPILHFLFAPAPLHISVPKQFRPALSRTPAAQEPPMSDVPDFTPQNPMSVPPPPARPRRSLFVRF